MKPHIQPRNVLYQLTDKERRIWKDLGLTHRGFITETVCASTGIHSNNAVAIWVVLEYMTPADLDKYIRHGGNHPIEVELRFQPGGYGAYSTYITYKPTPFKGADTPRIYASGKCYHWRIMRFIQYIETCR